jgi:hypothetical protein
VSEDQIKKNREARDAFNEKERLRKEAIAEKEKKRCLDEITLSRFCTKWTKWTKWTKCRQKTTIYKKKKT